MAIGVYFKKSIGGQIVTLLGGWIQFDHASAVAAHATAFGGQYHLSQLPIAGYSILKSGTDRRSCKTRRQRQHSDGA